MLLISQATLILLQTETLKKCERGDYSTIAAQNHTLASWNVQECKHCALIALFKSVNLCFKRLRHISFALLRNLRALMSRSEANKQRTVQHVNSYACERFLRAELTSNTYTSLDFMPQYTNPLELLNVPCSLR